MALHNHPEHWKVDMVFIRSPLKETRLLQSVSTGVYYSLQRQPLHREQGLPAISREAEHVAVRCFDIVGGGAQKAVKESCEFFGRGFCTDFNSDYASAPVHDQSGWDCCSVHSREYSLIITSD